MSGLRKYCLIGGEGRHHFGSLGRCLRCIGGDKSELNKDRREIVEDDSFKAEFPLRSMRLRGMDVAI